MSIYPATHQKRIFGLDLLRAIAIFNVVHLHGYFYIQSYIPLTWYRLPVIADGVALFFVLSGFLIGSILLDLFDRPGFKRSDIGIFWKRRWLRTLPNYYLILFLVSAISPFAYTELLPLIWRFALFLQNFYSPHPNFFNEAWSLSVEEWFYLFLPIGLMVGKKITSLRNTIVSLILLTLLITTAIRFQRYLYYGPISAKEWDFIFRRQVIMQFDSLMFGVCAATLKKYAQYYWSKYSNTSMLGGLAGFVLIKFVDIYYPHERYGFYMQVLYFPLISILTMLLIPYLSSFDIKGGIIASIVRQLSTLSYAIYVLNFSFILNWLLPKLGDWHTALNQGFVGLFLFWTITLLLSSLLYRFYERPLTNLRDRF